MQFINPIFPGRSQQESSRISTVCSASQQETRPNGILRNRSHSFAFAEEHDSGPSHGNASRIYNGIINKQFLINFYFLDPFAPPNRR